MRRPNAVDIQNAVAFRHWRFPRWLGEDINPGDRLFRILTALLSAGLLVLAGALVWQLTAAAVPALQKFGWGFVSGKNWDPVQDAFGALPFLAGTLLSSALALVLAVPISLGVAIYLAELAPAWLAGPVGTLVELLAAIPSVIYGLFYIFVCAPVMRKIVEPVLVPVFGGAARGFDLLAAGLVLAVMILPTIASVSRDVLRAVPRTLREGALALGATRWETIRFAVLPAAKSGLTGAVILGLGRALGETMAVTMVIGNRAEVPSSLLAPAATMASVIANEYAEATGTLHMAALSEIALLLFAVTLALNVVARLLVWRVGRVAA